MMGTIVQFDGSDGGTVTRIQSCSLDDTTKAVCSITTAVELSGKASTVSQVATFTGTDVIYGQVPIVGGVKQLQASELAACTITSTGGASVATGFSQVYKIVVIPGAAALLAGAFA